MASSTAITDEWVNEAGIEDWDLDKARRNLINLTDTIFKDGTWGIEPDCIEWTQIHNRTETGRGEKGEFNFRCDAVYSVMSGDRRKATPIINKLDLYECVSLTECVLRYWLCEFLSRPTNWEEDHMDIIETKYGFRQAAQKVFELPKRMGEAEILRQFCQEELKGLNTSAELSGAS